MAASGQIETQLSIILQSIDNVNQTTKQEVLALSSGTTTPEAKEQEAAVIYDETFDSPHSPLSMNDKLNQISALTLTDLLQEIDANDRFTVHKSFFFVALFAMVFMITGNSSFYGLDKSMRWIVTTFFAVVLFLSIIFIVYAVYFSDKPWEIYVSERLNIGDEPDKDLFLMNMYNKSGPVFVILVIYGCCSLLLFDLLYSDVVYDSSKCEDDVYKMDCLAVYSTFGQTYPFIWACALMMWGVKKINCSAEIKKLKNMVFFKCKHAKAIDDAIKTNFLSKWEISKEWKNVTSKERIFTFLCGFFIIVINQGFVRNDFTSLEFNKPLDYVSMVIAIICYIGDAFIWSVMLYSAFLVYKHFNFPYVVMMGLLSPINANEPDSIIAWWELRRFYIDVIGEIYCSSLEISISAFLVAVFLVGVFVLDFLGDVGLGTTMVCLCAMAVSLFIAFGLVSNAVSYHSVQLLHAGTMNKEKIRLNRVWFYDDDTDAAHKKNEKLLNIIDFIVFDIQENSVPLRILGVKIHQNFMLFLRATVVTFIILFSTFFADADTMANIT